MANRRGIFYSVFSFPESGFNQRMKQHSLYLGLVFLLSLSSAHAKLIQIIHTNDLHSYFQGTRTGLGGYARLKTVIKQLRADAEAQKIPTLFLDGGDFGEGSSFYFSNQGVDSLKALDELGVDVTVLGNHDYMLGGRELSRQIRKAGLKAKILSANVLGKRFMGLSGLLQDYVDYEIADLKIRVFGLTTSDLHYQYPFRPVGYITSSHNAGIRMANKARREGVDYLIGLTHVGLEKDIQLVSKSRTIDLVVGGHSHTKLYKPVMTRNLNGKDVPILQAGAHSLYVGSFLVDVKPKGESVMVDYRMYDVTQEVPEDQSMKEFVDQAYVKRDMYFNRSWNEVIGFSEIKLSGNVNGHQTEYRTCWSRHIARLTREVASADLGLQFDSFQGEEIPPGPITFGDVVDNFPHFRNWNDRGWQISTAVVNGFLLRKILQVMASSAEAVQVTIDGVLSKQDQKRAQQFDLLSHSAETALINGEPILGPREYLVALPSEVPYGVMKLFNFLGYFLLKNVRTVPDSHYWPQLENYIAKHSPLRCIED